jgi:hypothetical protein
MRAAFLLIAVTILARAVQVRHIEPPPGTADFQRAPPHIGAGTVNRSTGRLERAGRRQPGAPSSSRAGNYTGHHLNPQRFQILHAKTSHQRKKITQMHNFVASNIITSGAKITNCRNNRAKNQLNRLLQHALFKLTIQVIKFLEKTQMNFMMCIQN